MSHYLHCKSGVSAPCTTCTYRKAVSNEPQPLEPHKPFRNEVELNVESTNQHTRQEINCVDTNRSPEVGERATDEEAETFSGDDEPD